MHPAKITKQLKQNQNTLNNLNFVLLAFLQDTCLFKASLKHSRSDLVFEQIYLIVLFSESTIALIWL